jgi:hypothetical protein
VIFRFAGEVGKSANLRWSKPAVVRKKKQGERAENFSEDYITLNFKWLRSVE